MTERNKRTTFMIENIPKALTSVAQWVPDAMDVSFYIIMLIFPNREKT